MIVSALLVTQAVFAASPNGFVIRDFEQRDGKRTASLRYALYVADPPIPKRGLPLLVYLHWNQDARDAAMWARNLVFNSAKRIGEYRCVALAIPHPSRNRSWREHTLNAENVELDLSFGVIKAIVSKYPIDKDRIYLTGVSAGGAKCWDMAYREPELFAAVVPMAAASMKIAEPERLVDIPIWAFHNLNDALVSADVTKNAVGHVLAAGGKAHLTCLPGSAEVQGHDCWTEAFEKHNILAWIFAQRRGSRICWTPPGTYPWKWRHIVTVPLLVAAIMTITLQYEHRRRQRASVSQSQSSN